VREPRNRDVHGARCNRTSRSFVKIIATSLATPRIAGPTGWIPNKTKTWFIVNGNNLVRMSGSKPIPANFIKIGKTCTRTVRVSGMIDETFKPIVSFIGEASTRPKRIDAR
jgi:hypothetical protein